MSKKSKPHQNVDEPKTLITFTVTMQEIWNHTQPRVYKNKKKYDRKLKHPKK